MPDLPTPGSDNGSWAGFLNTWLEVAHNADGSLKPVVLNVFSGTTYVPGQGDANTETLFTSDSAITIVVPPGLAVPAGTWWNFRQMGLGTPIVTWSDPVLVNTPAGATPRAQFSTISLMRDPSADTFILGGDLATS